tara:strand:+ start:176 stop:490 length:315 start_codon:yes stop_codon:yes gene_type:complete
MSLIQTIRSASHIRDEFNRYGRYSQFTYYAYDALFEYYNELSDNTGEPIEFDVVAICCEWTEYDSLQELASAYGLDDSDDLRDIGTLLPVENSNGAILSWLFSE